MFVAVSPIPLGGVRPFFLLYRYRYRNTELFSVRYIYIYTRYIYIYISLIERIKSFSTISNTSLDWTQPDRLFLVGNCIPYALPHITPLYMYENPYISNQHTRTAHSSSHRGIITASQHSITSSSGCCR